MAEKTKKPVMPALPGMRRIRFGGRRRQRHPLKCPPRIQPDVRLNEQPRVRLHVVPGANCGGTMRIVAFIEEKTTLNISSH
jgi:hypothetical protein